MSSHCVLSKWVLITEVFIREEEYRIQYGNLMKKLRQGTGEEERDLDSMLLALKKDEITMTQGMHEDVVPCE